VRLIEHNETISQTKGVFASEHAEPSVIELGYELLIEKRNFGR